MSWIKSILSSIGGGLSSMFKYLFQTKRAKIVAAVLIFMFVQVYGTASQDVQNQRYNAIITQILNL